VGAGLATPIWSGTGFEIAELGQSDAMLACKSKQQKYPAWESVNSSCGRLIGYGCSHAPYVWYPT